MAVYAKRNGEFEFGKYICQIDIRRALGLSRLHLLLRSRLSRRMLVAVTSTFGPAQPVPTGPGWRRAEPAAGGATSMSCRHRVRRRGS